MDRVSLLFAHDDVPGRDLGRERRLHHHGLVGLDGHVLLEGLEPGLLDDDVVGRQRDTLAGCQRGEAERFAVELHVRARFVRRDADCSGEVGELVERVGDRVAVGGRQLRAVHLEQAVVSLVGLGEVAHVAMALRDVPQRRGAASQAVRGFELRERLGVRVLSVELEALREARLRFGSVVGGGGRGRRGRGGRGSRRGRHLRPCGRRERDERRARKPEDARRGHG